MKVCVVGLGYIGLPTALMLASHGVEVDAVDCNPEIVEKLRNQQLSFSEKGLEELHAAAVKETIRFHTACVPAKVYIVAVPTPYVEQTKQIDLCLSIRNCIKRAPKSTVPGQHRFGF